MATKSIGSLAVLLGLDTKKFEASLKKTEKDITKLSKRFKSVGGDLSKYVTLPLSVAAAGMVKAASDAEETGSKFQTVFKDVGKDAKKVADELKKSYGLSRTESKKLLADTGDLLTGFGFAGGEALGLAEKVQKLAVDLASFTNVEGGASRASEALTKALLGEREMLKTYGVAVLEADVKAQILANGKSKLTGEALRQAKAEATLQIAMRQSQNAIGDFARTQDSFANQSRGLQNDINDLAVSFGEILLPYAGKLVKIFRSILQRIDSLNPSFKKTVIIVGAIAAAIGPLTVVMGTLLALLPPMIAGWRTLATVQLASARAFAIATIKITAVIAAITGLVLVAQAIEESWSKFLIFFARLWSQIAVTVSNGALSVIESIESISSVIGIEFGEAKKGLEGFRDAAQKNLDVLPLVTFSDVASEVGEKIKNTFFDLKDSVVGSVTGINESLDGLNGTPTTTGGGSGGGKSKDKKTKDVKPKGFAGLSAILDEIIPKLEKIKNVSKESSEKAKESFDDLGDSMASSFLQGIQGADNLADAIKKSAKSTIGSLLNESIALAIRNTLSSKEGILAGPFGVALAGTAGIAAKKLFTSLVPGFANGGNFGGGLRLVGERGPELEATGASRITSNSKLKSMLGGGQNITVTVRGEVSGDKLKYVMDQYSINSGYRN